MAGLGFGDDGLYGKIYINKKEERGPEILKAASICCSIYCGFCFELTQRFASLDFKLKFVEVLSLLEIHVIMLRSCS
jgi:hypothetical protein